MESFKQLYSTVAAKVAVVRDSWPKRMTPAQLRLWWADPQDQEAWYMHHQVPWRRVIDTVNGYGTFIIDGDKYAKRLSDLGITKKKVAVPIEERPVNADDDSDCEPVAIFYNRIKSQEKLIELYNRFGHFEVEDCEEVEYPEAIFHTKVGACVDTHTKRELTGGDDDDFNRLLAFCELACERVHTRIIRDIHLLKKIRTKILTLEMIRSRGYVHSHYIEKIQHMVEDAWETIDPIIATPEGDEVGVHGSGEVSSEEASNVTLTRQRETNVALYAQPATRWGDWVTNDVIDDYATLTDRWLNIASFAWTTSDPVDYDALWLRLPVGIFREVNGSCNMPNLLPFRVHAYWRGDMEIKLQVNSNKFQVGQLMLAWYYSANAVKDSASKLTVWGFSQMPHALVSASASNEATLRVNYKSTYPFLNTRAVADIDRPLDLGKVYVKVLNPLVVGEGGPQQAKCNLYVRFINSEFTGMLSGIFSTVEQVTKMAGNYKIGHPEGPVLDLVKEGEKLLNTTLSGLNLDKPPYVQAPQYLVPTGMHSLALGNNVLEPIQPMRLDARGQTQHPVGCADNEALTVAACVSHYGLISQINWSKDTPRGMSLMSTGATPFAVSNKSVTNGSLRGVWMAPVGVIASNFMSWRGSLEYRFDIVASPFHTGRIMVGYAPSVSDPADKRMTMDALQACSHVVFDLQDGNSFTYEVPYVSYRPWWPRQISGNYITANVDAPSTLWVFVKASLIPMQSVAPSVWINVYVRGGKSFEVAVPVQPAVGLGSSSDFVLRDPEQFTAVSGYAPYYAGVWHSFVSSTKLVFRWGTASDQIAQFNTPIPVPSNKALYFSIADASQAAIGTVAWKYMLVWPSGHGYNIGIPIQSQAYAEAAARILYTTKDLNNKQLLNYYSSSTMQGPGKYSGPNPIWEAILIARNVRDLPDVEPFVVVEAESDEIAAQVLLRPPSGLKHTGYGMSFYGEAFNDLKSLMRRYQLYGQLELSATTEVDADRCTFIFPAMPQGLTLDVGIPAKPKEIFNRCREGIIPLILSAFRFYRGSLRFKIVFPDVLDGNVWVQVRPDRAWSIKEDRIVTCTAITTAQGVQNHGYATTIQIARVNNVVEFEVPYYNPGCYNLLQRPIPFHERDAWQISLGQVAVGFSVSTAQFQQLVNKNVYIYYALGDDFQVSEWVGFSPVLLLDNLPAVEKKVARPEGWLERVVPKKAIDGIVEEQKMEIVAQLKDTVTEVMDTVNQIAAKENVVNSSSLFNILSQMVHTILNANVKTFLWSIASILCTLGIIAWDSLSWVMNVAKRVYAKYFPQATQNQNAELGTDAVVASPEGPSDDEATEAGSWLSILYTGVCGMLQLRATKPRNWQSWTKYFTVDFGQNLRSSNQLFVFVRNTFDVLKRMIHYCLGRANPDYSLLQTLEKSSEMVKEWAKEVLYLDDPLKRQDELDNPSYTDRVHAAHAFGQLLITDLSEETRLSKQIGFLSKLYDRIDKLRTTLLEMGKYPYVRKDCFSVTLTGEAGIGKSYITTYICAALLKATKTKFKGSMICTINPLSEFWDQCEHQPVLSMDDLWAVETPAALEKQLTALFQVCSPIVLSPPKAELSEKKMRYNPEIFWVNTNKPFPVFPNVLGEAVYRRRHVLLEARLSKTTIPKCPHCHEGMKIEDVAAKWLSDFHHLEFRMANDVRNPMTQYTAWMDYTSMMEKLVPVYLLNRSKAQETFKSRVAEIELARDHSELSGDTILDKYTELLKSKQEQCINIKNRTLCSDFKLACTSAGGLVEKILSKFDIAELVLPQWAKEGTIVAPEGENDEDETSTHKAIEALYEASKKQLASLDDEEDGDALTIDQALALTQEFKSEKLEYYVERGYVLKKTAKVWVEWLSKLGEDVSAFNNVLANFVDTIDALSFKVQKPIKLPTDFCKAIAKLMELKRRDSPKNSNYCRHLYCDMEKSVLIKNRITFNVKRCGSRFNEEEIYDNDLCVATEGCALNSKAFNYALHQNWLRHYPTMRLLYDQHRVSLLPAYYSSSTCKEFLQIDSKLKQLALWLSTQYKRYIVGPLGSLWTFLEKIWPYLLPIVPILTGFALVKYAAQEDQKYLDRLESAESASRSWNAQVNLQPQAMRYEAETPKATVARATPLRAQGTSSQTDAAIQRLISNTVFVEAHLSTGKIHSMRCLLLVGHDMLFLRHYRESALRFPKDTVYFLRYAHDHKNRCTDARGMQFNFLERPQRYYGGQVDGSAFDSNLGIMKLPAQFPMARDLTKFIACAHDTHVGGDVALVEYGVLSSAPVMRGLSVDYRANSPHVIRDGGLADVVMQQLYMYPYHGKGVCGSVLLNRSAQRPIMGIHVAGYEKGAGYGIAEPLSADMFAICHDTRENVTQAMQMPLLPAAVASTKLDGTLFPYGAVPKQLASVQSGVTRICKSAIHGTCEVQTEPAPLTRKDARMQGQDPLVLGCNKHGQLGRPFKESDVDRAARHLGDKLLVAVKPIMPVHKTAMDIAVCGSPTLPECSALSWDTSAGFPLASVKPAKCIGKKWLFNLNETQAGYELVSLHEELARQVAIIEDACRKRIKPFVIFTDCLKDSTLPLQKARTPGKTRIFSISPIQYTIPFRQCFLPFMASYRRARLEAEHAIGIDVNSTEWTALAQKISIKGKHLVTGDYSNFGPSLDLNVVRAALEIIYRWIAEHTDAEDKTEYLAQCRTLGDCLIGSYHLAGDLVYSVAGGIPSGSPITDILNSLANCIYVRVAYLRIFGTLENFDKNVSLVVYGDDLIMNVAPDIIEKFNTITLSRFFGEQGIRFTDADKTGELVVSRDLTTATFLKHSFNAHPYRKHIFLAKLDEVSIESPTNWVRKNLPLNEATVQNAVQSVELAFGCGKAYYDQHVNKLKRAMREQNLYAEFGEWDEVDMRVFG